MSVRDTGMRRDVIRVRPDDSLDNYPGLSRAEMERYDRFRRTGVGSPLVRFWRWVIGAPA